MKILKKELFERIYIWMNVQSNPISESFWRFT